MDEEDRTNDARTLGNRRNANESTGPKTEAGKAISSMNALKRGFWSRDAVLAGESEEEFAEFHAQVLSDLKPESGLEHWFVERIIANMWRMKRVIRTERELVAEQLLIDKSNSVGRAYLNDCRGVGALAKLARDENRIERFIARELHEVQRLQALRSGQLVPLPIAADIDLTVSHRVEEASRS